MKFAFNGDKTKPVLLFVHGSPGSWEGWTHFLKDPDLLAHFFIIAVDRPGFGGSGAGNPERSLRQQALMILDVLQFAQNSAQVILVGHSYGGPVVAQMAVLVPEKIKGVVFAASSVSPQLEDVRWYQHLGHAWPFRYLLSDDLSSCNEEIYVLEKELTKLAPGLKDFRPSVSIVHGDADPLVPVANVAYLHEKLPVGSIKFERVLKGANHFLPWEHPQDIKDAILTLR